MSLGLSSLKSSTLRKTISLIFLYIFSFQLKSDPKKFFQNRLSEQKIRMENTLAARGSVMSRYRWGMRPTEINAYYSAQSNKIGEFTLTGSTMVKRTTRAHVSAVVPAKSAASINF